MEIRIMRIVKEILLFIWEVSKIVIIAAVIVIPIRYFIFQPFFVKGASMEPNFSNGDYLIVDELSYHFREPKRGEVVVFKSPNKTSQMYIKRIIGLPGETVEIKDGKIIVYLTPFSDGSFLDESEYLSYNVYTPGEMRISLGDNEYFVLGDNRSYSSDSRIWGPLIREDIIGRVVFRPWPITAVAAIHTPGYFRE